MSGYIPKEELGSFQRWQIDSFDRPAASKAPPPKPAPAAPAPAIEEPAPQHPQPDPAELARIHEAARAQGYEEGYEAGRQAGEQLGQELAIAQMQQLASLNENFRQAITGMEQEVADQLLNLAVEIAAKMVGSAINVKDDLLQPIVREAIAALPLHHTHVTLRLNPEDAEKVRQHMGEQLAQQSTQIVEDSGISPGGCLVRSGASEIDATIETRWKRVLEAIGVEPREWLRD